MKEIKLEELKQIEYNTLVFFDEFCRKNSIEYSLTGGTLLGAIRHKGFIPWDDDIDIMMMRSQYDRFLSEFPEYAKNSNYQLVTYQNKKNYNYLFAKIVDTRTSLVEDHNLPIEGFGVYIDIFPIDFIDDDYAKSKKMLEKITFKKYLCVASNWRHLYINKNHNFLRQIPRFIFFFLSRLINARKMLSKIEKDFSNISNKKYVACICGSYSIEKELMESHLFDKYIELDFEQGHFMSIDGYEYYLRAIYGDYNVLPPVEKRFTRHTFVASYKEENH